MAPTNGFAVATQGTGFSVTFASGVAGRGTSEISASRASIQASV
jgi:hypothetical protein